MTSASPKAPSIEADPGAHHRVLGEGWRLRTFEAGSHAMPGSLRLDEGEWVSTTVPCTVASALRDSGSTNAQAVEKLDDADHWFHCEFDWSTPVGDTMELVFDGLATLSEIWLNDAKLGSTQNMFVQSVYDVTNLLRPRNELWICFRALKPTLQKKRARARWRTRLVSERNLRFIRTTLLGRMPSWTPSIAPVGPWREVSIRSKSAESIRLERTSLRGTSDAGYPDQGRVEVEIDLAIPASRSANEAKISLEVAGIKTPLQIVSSEQTHLRATGSYPIEGVKPWWPHTHGMPQRYPVTLHVELGWVTRQFELDPIAFSRIELVGPPGPEFALEVNGETIFCRGTCWTPVDSLALGCSKEAMRAALEQVRHAGMNMLRVSGTMTYENDDFYQLCDELGILIWQDFMFATLDYPSDADFLASVRTEVEQFLNRVASRTCIAVLCGNSEGQQQPAMLGLAGDSWASPLFDELLPGLCEQLRPDTPYWPSTPSGGDLPFRPNHGTSHYFGVGAYRRPLTDATLARPRFMTECLALSNVASTSGADRTPRARIPRDVGADWDFKDITDHYLATFYMGGAGDKSQQAPALSAALSRATSTRLMEELGTRWRDPESGCRGALVWLHRDPWDCSGWGVIDAGGQPKSAYFGLKRAWAPIALAFLDEGLNGLRLIAFNDREEDLAGTLDLRLMRFDGTLIDQFERAFVVEARSSHSLRVDDFLGSFVDSSYAYRFGPHEFDLCVARLAIDSTDSCAPLDSFDGKVEVEALYLHAEAGLCSRETVGLDAQWRSIAGEDATLSITTQRFAQTVVIELENGTASDNFFHLSPGGERKIAVVVSDANRPVHGRVSALNAAEIVALPLFPKARP